MRISFAGERGSYAEAAAARMFANEDIATMPVRNYRAAFDALANGEVDYTVVPLENSFHGPNTPLFDHLRERRCYISRESRITEIYNLAGQKGAKLSDIKRIHAHPAPLSLCQDFLEKLDGVEIITRFVAIGRELEVPPADADDPRTMILFELKHVAGALLSVLEVMKKYNISVHQMGARPNRVNKFEYMIALEFPGRANDKPVAAALKELKSRTTYLQLLGSYDKVEMGTSSGRFKPFKPAK